MSLLVVRALEGGWLGGPGARALAGAWSALAAGHLTRALPRRPGVRVLTVGGATLGGSGSTPLAIACAAVLARAGARVAFVGHGYRARPPRARQVHEDDPVAVVGDEALVACRGLGSLGVPVFVARARADAARAAAEAHDVLVLDGVVQCAPRADLALLAVDAGEPWGAGLTPPAGDLRASISTLRVATDRLVAVGDGSPDAAPCSPGARLRGRTCGWDELSCTPVGLATALARPERLLAFLARRGVVPRRVVRARDHHGLPAAPLRPDLLWLATEKCALHWPAGVAPPAVVAHALTLSPELTGLVMQLS